MKDVPKQTGFCESRIFVHGMCIGVVLDVDWALSMMNTTPKIEGKPFLLVVLVVPRSIVIASEYETAL